MFKNMLIILLIISFIPLFSYSWMVDSNGSFKDHISHTTHIIAAKVLTTRSDTPKTDAESRHNHNYFRVAIDQFICGEPLFDTIDLDYSFTIPNCVEVIEGDTVIYWPIISGCLLSCSLNKGEEYLFYLEKHQSKYNVLWIDRICEYDSLKSFLLSSTNLKCVKNINLIKSSWTKCIKPDSNAIKTEIDKIKAELERLKNAN